MKKKRRIVLITILIVALALLAVFFVYQKRNQDCDCKETKTVVENSIEPTCTIAGSYDNVVYCTACGKEFSRETVTVDALGHTYKPVVTAPTCTENGYTIYKCTVCKDTYASDYTDPTGHIFKKTVTVGATCTEGTYVVKICANCGIGYEKTDVGEPLGHSYKAGTCVRCGADDPDFIGYARCDADGNEDENGTYILFGEYPQSKVTDTTLAEALNVSASADGWISYEYYISGSNTTDFMWYQDVTYDGEIYRGVYFTNYRPYYATGNSGAIATYQDDNGYTLNTASTAYWFKWEPLLWTILTEEDGKAMLLCTSIIDSMQYYDNYNNRTVDGETVYANNYAESNIRAWLNVTFYETAFSELQQGIILTTEVDNSASGLYNAGYEGTADGTYACENTFDKIFLLSQEEVTNTLYGFDVYNVYDVARSRQSSDYAQCQGSYVSTDSDYSGTGHWWLRSSYYGDAQYARIVYADGYADNRDCVDSTIYGVVPALWISLVSVEHTHTEAEAVIENKVDATCTTAGSYDSVVYCTDCGEELSRETITVDALGHSYVDGYCSVCGATEVTPSGEGYVRCDADGNEDENGDYILFGEYPQTKVTDTTLTDALTASASADGWISYEYYISGSNTTDFMWYQDVTYEGERYRGVYFTSYRPYWTDYSSSTSNSNQDDNGYTLNTSTTAYWFKWEPLLWTILTEEDGKAMLLCTSIIDSMEYYNSTSTRTIDGETVYANNYAESNIRAWLNATFYETAFSELQQGIILTTEVDNSASGLYNAGYEGTADGTYACENTFDKIFLLSQEEVTNSNYGFSSYSTSDTARRMQTSDYAQCQGCWTSTSTNYAGNGYWWLRSPCYGNSYSARYVYGDGGASSSLYVNYSNSGVVPALWIGL